MPVSFVGKIGGEFGIVGGQFTDADSKDAYATAVRKIASEIKANFVLFISESWTLDQEDAHEFAANRWKYPSVSSHPRKKEAVMAVLETKTALFLGMTPILAVPPLQWARKPGRKTLGEMKFSQPDKFSGRFTEFLS